MPAKRKAKDIAPPTPPARYRARSARTSKAAPATDGNDSESPLPRPVKKLRAAASRAAKQNGGEDDDFGDYGRGSSKPATIEQHLMDQNKKSKDFLQSFKEQVAQGRELAEETLARLKQDLTKPSAPINDTNLLSETSTTLHTAAVQALSPKDHPLLAQTQHLLRLSHAVLRCHQTVDAAASRAPLDLTSPRETWMQDEEGMRQLLAYGRVHGERAVEGWIAPRGDGESCEMTDGEEEDGGSEEERERRREAENLARGLFEWRRKGRGLGLGEGAESWGVAARRQMGALVGVVRTLPSSNKGGK